MKSKKIYDEDDMSSLIKFFGSKLYAFRIAKNLTLKEAAKQLHTTPNHLSKIEKGISCFSIPLLFSLGFFYDFEPQEFLKISKAKSI